MQSRSENRKKKQEKQRIILGIIILILAILITIITASIISKNTAKEVATKEPESLADEFVNSVNTQNFEEDVNEEITFAAMVPMQVYNTLQVPEERARLCCIRHLIIGGGAIDEALEQKLKALPGDVAIWSTYGMTETLSHIALRRINGAEASEWYQPFDSVRISQTDEGCLVIDAPQVCAEPLVTNDIVEIESYIYNKVEKLRFRIKGRKDNVICSGGIKIQIEEVEALLKPYLEKPFMIAKKKDGKFGEIAVLLTEDEEIEKVEATVRRLLSDHKYWIPREFLHVEHLPLTETGKPKRSIFL